MSNLMNKTFHAANKKVNEDLEYMKKVLSINNHDTKYYTTNNKWIGTQELWNDMKNIYGIMPKDPQEKSLTLEEKVDILTDKINALNRKIDFIFDNHILINGQFINFSKEK